MKRFLQTVDAATPWHLLVPFLQLEFYVVAKKLLKKRNMKSMFLTKDTNKASNTSPCMKLNAHKAFRGISVATMKSPPNL